MLMLVAIPAAPPTPWPTLTPAPAPTPWPTGFTADIMTNLSWSDPYGDRSVDGTMWYEWDVQALRVQHGAGNLECIKFYDAHDGCTIMHLPGGTYRLLEKPPTGVPSCCLDIGFIHAPPPDWATRLQPTNVPDDVRIPWTYFDAHGYQYPQTGTCNSIGHGNNSGCHSYYEVNWQGSGRPGLFTFPAANGLQDWYFNPGLMKVGPQPLELFDLPAGCANTSCPKLRLDPLVPWGRAAP